MTVNKRVQNWIATEDIRRVLLGEDGFFIRDPTFREEHDVLLILNQALAMMSNSCLTSKSFRERMASALVGIEDDTKLADIARCIILVEGELNQGLLIDREYLSDLIWDRFQQSQATILGKVVDLLEKGH